MDGRQKKRLRVSKAELLHSPIVQPIRFMQGGSVANQMCFLPAREAWHPASQAAVTCSMSTAVENKDLPLSIVVQDAFTHVRMFLSDMSQVCISQ